MDYPLPEKETSALPGLIFLSGNSDNGGEISRVDDLIGKKINSISSCEDGILASMQDGLYNVCHESTSCLIKDTEYKNVAAGKGFIVAQTPEGGLYSWGKGFNGQLGLGVTRFTNEAPANIKDSKFSAITCGDAFTIAVDDTGKAFSWGENFDRQLALYTKKQESMHLKNVFVEDMSFVPRLIPFTFKNYVQKVACGNKFAVALTKEGGKVYSWGAGECGQLGTGRCTKRDLPEEIKIPLLPYQEKAKQAADSAIAEAAGIDADVEAEKAASKVASVVIGDVACGSGHLLLSSTEGLLYACGLNKSGQLGLGDNATRFAVQCLYSGDSEDSTCLTVLSAKDLVANEPSVNTEVRFSKVFADEHSSAAVDTTGKLYTWGSEAHHRLIHPFAVSSEWSHCAYPAEVSTTLLNGCKVSDFSFSKKCSAVQVLATICSLTPAIGPRRAFSNLDIHGYGLWDSQEIIVKFSPKIASIYNLPRSSAGDLTSTGVISCKPPKFAESGYYMVSVSLDGFSFLTQNLEVYIYKDPVVTNQSPSFLDARNICNTSVKVNVSGNVIPPQDEEIQHRVKLQFFPAIDNHLKQKDTDISRKEEKLRYHPDKIILEVTVNAIVESVTEEAPAAPAPGQTLPGSHLKAVTIDTMLSCDFSDIDASVFDMLLGKGLCEMKCMVTVNKQDYSAVNFDSRASTIVHIFSPKKLSPCCLAFTEIESTFKTSENEECGGETKSEKVLSREDLYEEKVVVVQGSSFIPNFRLPKGSSVEAVLTGVGLVTPAALTEVENEDGSIEMITPEATPFTLNLSSHCEHPDSLHFLLSAGSLEQLYNMMISQSSSLQFDVSFNMIVSTDALDDGAVPLSNIDDVLSYTVYGDYKLAIEPVSCRRVKPSQNGEEDDPPSVRPTTESFSIMYDTNQQYNEEGDYGMYSNDEGLLFEPSNPVVCLRLDVNIEGEGEGEAEGGGGDAPTESALRQTIRISSGVRVTELVPRAPPPTPTYTEYTDSRPNTGEYEDSRPNTSGTDYSEFNEPAEGEEGYEEYQAMKAQSQGQGQGQEQDGNVKGAEGEVAEVQGGTRKQYQVEFDLNLDLSTYFPSLSAAELDALNAIETVHVAVLLDGKTVPADLYWATLTMYGNIADNMTFPPVKGGHDAGAEIDAVCEGYCPPTDALVVRIRGMEEGVVRDIPGVAAQTGNPGSISFTLGRIYDPDEGDVIKPVMNGKEKMVYVDISTDGGTTFNVAEVPKLLTK